MARSHEQTPLIPGDLGRTPGSDTTLTVGTVRPAVLPDHSPSLCRCNPLITGDSPAGAVSDAVRRTGSDRLREAGLVHCPLSAVQCLDSGDK